MKGRDVVEIEITDGASESGSELLHPLIAEPVGGNQHGTAASVLIGTLVGLADGGRIPLVTYQGQAGTAAFHAQTVVDVHGQHIGRRVVLMLEAGDRTKPVIMGLLQEQEGWPLEAAVGLVEATADGTRLLVSAREQVVIRCGEASITLTRAGKVLIKGTYIVTHSSGVNRIKGGAVQIN
jgi:hypothetical protein